LGRTFPKVSSGIRENSRFLETRPGDRRMNPLRGRCGSAFRSLASRFISKSGRDDRVDCRGARRNRIPQIQRQYIGTDNARNARRRGADRAVRYTCSPAVCGRAADRVRASHAYAEIDATERPIHGVCGPARAEPWLDGTPAMALVLFYERTFFLDLDQRNWDL
jgi:hypothetical protein